jgi:nucleotide-binding universal stress UspA family protein
MYNKILVPMDGSENAECILEHVKTVATGCHVAGVVLLRVIEPFPTYYMDYRLSDTFIRQAQDALKSDAAEYLARVAGNMTKEGMSVSTAVLEGHAADIILDYAAKNCIDLIIMATHGRTGISRWALGSVAEKVVRSSNAPVMVVAPAGCRVTV